MTKAIQHDEDWAPKPVVYFLADPRSPRTPRYVGSTRAPLMRATAHKTSSHPSNPELAAWKASLRADGVAPLFVVLEECVDRDVAFAREWRLTARLRRRGMPLLNRSGERAKANVQRRFVAKFGRDAE